jgi:hypothetical protein
VNGIPCTQPAHRLVQVELGPRLEPRRLHKATACRAAELAVAADQALADRFDEAASRAGRGGEGIEPG